MKILSAEEKTISLGSDTANAAISFENMTASAVVIEVETAKGRFHGLGFSSYGRYGHGGLLRERFIPRLLAVDEGDLVHDDGTYCPEKAWTVLMTDEKEGGHGERSGAVGVLEMALWDAWAKSNDLPLWALLRDTYGHTGDDGPSAGTCYVYASGGHYRLGDSDASEVAEEARHCIEEGYGWFKLKVAGAPEGVDKSRIEAAIEAVKDPGLVAIDANGMLGGAESAARRETLDQYSLRWIEEPVAPLDLAGLGHCAGSLKTPLATGENIFSAADTQNILQFGGLRPGRDKLQMDPPLSYGLVEYVRMINIAEAAGWSRRDFHPHAGHQLTLHAAAGLGLGSHETASVPGGPFSGVDDNTSIEEGFAVLGEAPGLGIENKPALYRFFEQLV